MIGGTARGRRLRGPAARKSRSGRDAGTIETRPTSDLIRGVIFNMLDAMGADYARVLDLYAGTGALGIEALSRGDGVAVFVEKDRDALEVIRANVDACGFGERAQVLPLTTERAIERLRSSIAISGAAGSGAFTLILADPPYYDDDAAAAVEAAARDLASDETVIVFEHHRRLDPLEALGGLPHYRSRRHGDTVVSIYGEPADEDGIEEDGT